MEFTIANVALVSLFESAIASYFYPQFFSTNTLTSFALVFFSFNTFIYVLYYLVVFPFFLNPLRHLPQPSGFIPIIGHGLDLAKRPRGQPQLKIMKEVENEGLVLTRGFLHTNRLLVTTPAAIADLLVHKAYDMEKPPWARDFLRKFLGDGLIMTEGDEHKHHRKQIMPAFHFRNIKELYPIFWSKSMEMIDAIKATLSEGESKVVEIGHFSTQVTLDIIGLAGLGRDIGSLRNDDDELIENYEELLEPTTEKAVYFALHLLLPGWFIAALPWKLNKRVKVITTNLKKICTEFVQQKKQNMKSESQESKDILSIMIRSNDFSDSNLVDQLLTFLAAG